MERARWFTDTRRPSTARNKSECRGPEGGVSGAALELHRAYGLTSGSLKLTPSGEELRRSDWQTGADIPILVLATALTRYAFRSHFLYDVDSVNFALALGRFDPSVHQPHPPGYFLYVLLGRLVNLAAHDANLALVSISIAASCGAVWMIYLLARDWFGRKAARWSAAFFILSPLAWFHGIVALTYSVETCFSALIGYLCWKRSVVGSAVLLGVAAGFRPSSLLFLAPLFFFQLWKAGWGRRLAGSAVLASVVLLWLIPMIGASGGFTAWSASLSSMWRIAPGRLTVFNSSIFNTAARFFTIVLIGGLCFGSATVLPFLGGRRAAMVHRRKLVFTCVWISPGLVFFTFVFLNFVNSGYLLFLTPPLFAWLGFFATDFMTPGRKVLAGAGLAINVAIFLWAPVYCSYGAVRRFETELQRVLASLPKIASPADTLLVGFDSHFMGYRHAGYYFPDYLTVEYPRMFIMQHRDTKASDGIPGGYSRFLIFPLPPDDRENRDYLTHVVKKLDPATLRFQRDRGNLFITGPIETLTTLFHVDP